MYKQAIKWWVMLFATLFIISFSFPHYLLPDVGYYLSPFFQSLAIFTAENIFGIQQPYESGLISDSTGMYAHVFNCMLISLALAVFVAGIKIKINSQKTLYWWLVIIRYYLALQLFTYGFNKLFKWQFYLPEPNTLFTKAGELYPDMLYWTSMGVSRTYTVFTGAGEVLAGLLLLFQRTRMLGGLLAFAMLLNVVVINFSFDISVKLYSAFLLLLSLCILAPDAKRLFAFFTGGIGHPSTEWKPVWKNKFVYLLLKMVTLIVLLADGLGMYISTGNYNDDKASRPLFHGAYEVTTFLRNGKVVEPLLTDPFRWRRMFIHRRGYFIVQHMNDEMIDSTLAYDSENKQLLIGENTFLRYNKPTDSTFYLYGLWRNDTISVSFKKINLSQLPAMQKEFHWTME